MEISRVKPSLLAAAMAGAAVTSAGSSAWAQGPGEATFAQRCGACHSIAPGPPKMGPPLKGVIGRKAGAVPDFKYSSAMRAQKLTWTAADLDRFLAAPAKLIPGTKMLVGVPDPNQRAAIISYLAAQK